MNDQQLVDRLARTAETLPGPAETSLARIQSRAHARRRRRRVLAVAAVMPVVIVAAVAVVQVLPAGPQQPIIEPLGDGRERVAPLELADAAMWRSPEVANVADAVGVFAEQALGWSEVSVQFATEEVGPVWVTIVGPEQRTVEGLFTPTPDEGVWQLIQLGDGPGVQRFEPWSVSIRPPTAATSADLYVRYEGQTWHLPLGDQQLQQREVRLVDHGLPEGSHIDSALIVYRDTAGTAFFAVGGHYSAPRQQAPSNGTDDPTDATAPSGIDQQRVPQVDQVDAEVGFEVYAIVAPDGWEHVDTGVRTTLPDEGAWTWVDTRWTPSGAAGGGEEDARLDLRQTDVSTLGDGSMPVHADADRIELQPELTAYLTTERLPSGIEHHLLEWQQGDTYLELRGQGLTAQELTDAAATTEPAPAE